MNYINNSSSISPKKEILIQNSVNKDLSYMPQSSAAVNKFYSGQTLASKLLKNNRR